MYTGSAHIQAFGNDTTTGSTIKLQRDDFSAYPFGGNCHIGALHSKETITFTNTTVMGGSQTFMFTLPKYGGHAAIHDTNADGVPDRAAGCLQSALEVGNPMYGKGVTLMTTGKSTTSRAASDPRGIDLPAGEFTVMNEGAYSAQSYGPYAFAVQYTDFSNPSATFRKGGGIGNFTWTETRKGPEKSAGSVTVTAGPNRFGGTMQMLGSFFSNEGFYYNAHLSVGKYSWLFQYNGAGAVTSGSTSMGGRGAVTQPGFTTEPNTIYTTLSGAVYPSNVFGVVFSWTTGTVSVTAIHGPFPTVLARNGFDNRNASGVGEIQLVTPMVTRWVWLAGNYETASIGHLRLNLTPEPQEWMMLGAGLSMLGLLYRSNRRSH
jgi:hypothetical protein